MAHEFMIALTTLLAAQAWASTVCSVPANRFRMDVFTTVVETLDLEFASAKNPLFGNRVESLKLDLYRPAGDACAKRPVILFIHGGWFQMGDRKGDAELCRRFARMGFVAASIEYRMAPYGVFTPANFMTPAYMASQDARAAVRWCRVHAATYAMDTSLVFVGGCSAGGYAALAAAYLDKPGEVPTFVDMASVGGGMEGAGGSPDLSSRFAGVINISGGMYDTSQMAKGDMPVVSVQCSGDPIVSPGRDSLRHPGTGKGFLVTYGATAVHARAAHLGIPNRVYTFRRACHCPENEGGAALDSMLGFIGRSLYGFMR